MAEVLDQPTVEQPTVELPSNGNGSHSEESGSLMATLRKKREKAKAAQDVPLELEIPDYGGFLACRYKRVDWEIVSEISDWINNSGEARAEVLGAADVLIACCDEMLTRKSGKYVPLREGPDLEPSVREALGDKPVRYEQRLATAFQYDAETAREVVLGLFPNDFTLVDQHRAVMRWLWTGRQKADEDF